MNLYFRLLVFMIRVRFRSRLSMWDTSRTSFRVNPADLDVQRHMNNGRYLTLMDLGRMDLMLRSGFWKRLTAQGWYPVVAGQSITYRKSLVLWQKFDIASRVLGHDDRWIYMEQVFRVGGRGLRRRHHPSTVPAEDRRIREHPGGARPCRLRPARHGCAGVGH